MQTTSTCEEELQITVKCLPAEKSHSHQSHCIKERQVNVIYIAQYHHKFATRGFIFCKAYTLSLDPRLGEGK